MKDIQFLGAAGGVTGSSFLLTGNDDQKLLVDLGIFQGIDDKQNINFSSLLFDAEKLQMVLLTHAHLDHCGRLPLLVKEGFMGTIYATEPTKMITEISLFDSLKVTQEEGKEPLYTKEEVEKTCSQIKVVSYDVPFMVDEWKIIFRNAGHILGAASIEISQPSLGLQTIVFSGDLGDSPEDLIQPIKYIDKAKIVVMEATYGSSIHPQEDVLGILQQEINIIEKTNGVLLIPAFSIERTQQILHKIDFLKGKNKIKKDLPVFLDSPMAIKVTEVFKRYPNFYNAKLFLDADPFNFPNLIRTKTVEESKNILQSSNPKIIIAGSGMMVGGRILYHLKNYLSLPLTRLLIVGYQAPGTLGRKIEDGVKKITIFGQKVEIKAVINKIESLSSHADQLHLLRWLKHIKDVEKVFLVHGENEQRTTLKEKIKKELGLENIFLPIRNEVFNLG